MATNQILIESNRAQSSLTATSTNGVWTTDLGNPVHIFAGDNISIHSAYINQVGGGIEDAISFDGGNVGIPDNSTTINTSYWRCADATNYAFMPVPIQSGGASIGIHSTQAGTTIEPFGYCNNFPVKQAYVDLTPDTPLPQPITKLAFCPTQNYNWDAYQYDRDSRNYSNWVGKGMGRFQHDGARYTNYYPGDVNLTAYATSNTYSGYQPTSTVQFNELLSNTDNVFMLGSGAYNYLLGNPNSKVSTFATQLEIPKGVTSASDVATILTNAIQGEVNIVPQLDRDDTVSNGLAAGLKLTSNSIKEFDALPEPTPLIDANHYATWDPVALKAIADAAPDPDPADTVPVSHGREFMQNISDIKSTSWRYNFWKENRGGGRCWEGDVSIVSSYDHGVTWNAKFNGNGPSAGTQGQLNHSVGRNCYMSQNRSGMSSIPQDRRNILTDSLFVRHPDLIEAGSKLNGVGMDTYDNTTGTPFTYILGPNICSNFEDGVSTPLLDMGIGDNIDGSLSHDFLYITTNLKWTLTNLQNCMSFFDEQHPDKMGIMPNCPVQYTDAVGNIDWVYEVTNTARSAIEYSSNRFRFIHLQHWFDSLTAAYGNNTGTGGLSAYGNKKWSMPPRSVPNTDVYASCAYRLGADYAYANSINDRVLNNTVVEPTASATGNQGLPTGSGHAITQYIDYLVDQDIRPTELTLDVTSWGGMLYKTHLESAQDLAGNTPVVGSDHDYKGDYISIRIPREGICYNGFVGEPTVVSEGGALDGLFGVLPVKNAQMPTIFGWSTDDSVAGTYAVNTTYCGWSPTMSAIGNAISGAGEAVSGAIDSTGEFLGENLPPYGDSQAAIMKFIEENFPDGTMSGLVNSGQNGINGLLEQIMEIYNSNSTNEVAQMQNPGNAFDPNINANLRLPQLKAQIPQ